MSPLGALDLRIMGGGGRKSKSVVKEKEGFASELSKARF